MYNKKYFAFIDIFITEIVPQRIQTQIMNSYLKNYKSEISFYSTEDHNSYKNLSNLNTKISEKLKIEGFIFYSFLQFCYDDHIRFNIIKKILKNYNCIFVRENIKLNKLSDIKSHKIALISFKDTHKSLIENLEKNFLKILDN